MHASHERPNGNGVVLVEAGRHLGRSARAVLVAGFVLLACGVAATAYRWALPTDGWTTTSGAIGSAFEDHVYFASNRLGLASSLRTGDYLVAVEGYAYPTLLAHAATLRSPSIDGWRAGATVRYVVERGGATLALDVPLGRWGGRDLLRSTLGDPLLLVGLASMGIGLFALLRRPEEVAAQALFFLTTVALVAQVSDIVSWGLPELLHPPLWLVAVLFGNWIYGGLFAPSLLLLTLTFPEPKPIIRRQPLLLVLGLYGALPMAVALAGPEPTLGWVWTAVCAVLSLASVVHTVATTADPVRRAQVRWASLGIAAVALNFALAATAGFGTYPPSVDELLRILDPVLTLVLPVTLAVAIVRYRLFAIDLILNRTLVYAALTLCVVGIYVGVVTYLSALLRHQDDLVASLVATGIVAVAFHPLRTGLQRIVDRRLFGRRGEPYTVITTLGDRIESAHAPGDVFGAIVTTIGQSLKLPHVAILDPEGVEVRAVFPPGAGGRPNPSAQVLRLPLRHQEQVVGVLEVAPRTGEARFARSEQRLLADLARPMSIAVYAAALSADLQRSRERIVLAREDERRRLRRDLHDGLGPHLASQTLTLDVIARLVRHDPDGAVALLHTVSQQVQAAVGEVRELIDGLRPPVLDDIGLHGAIAELVERVRLHGNPLEVALALPERAPEELPAAVEVACFRIAQEALTNVVRHARATHCAVRLSYGGTVGVDGSARGAHAGPLSVEISDDGVGIPVDRRAGVGLQSMRERSEELGGRLTLTSGTGGTTVRAVLPLGTEGPRGHPHLDRR